MKNKILLLFSTMIVSCGQDDYVKKEYNDPAKVLNIQDLDTNSIYVCLSPDSYKRVNIELDSIIIFTDSNFVNDFVPAKLVFSSKKMSNNIKLHIKIDNMIDTTISQNLIGVHKIMVGKSVENSFYYRTNLDPMAWIVN